MPEHNEAPVKRAFAAFLDLTKASPIKETFVKEGRLRPLLHVFHYAATTELQKDRSISDNGWKPTVDRHAALFIGLVCSTLAEGTMARRELALQMRETEVHIQSQEIQFAGKCHRYQQCLG